MSQGEPPRKRKSRAKPPHLRQKPGPKPKVQTMVEGVDYFCGICAGHGRVVCYECGIIGCDVCKRSGYVKCPQCKGGAIPQPPPLWW